MGESVHKNRISSIHQSLDPVYALFQEKHGSVRLLQHLIFPLKKWKIDITKYGANVSGLDHTNPDIFQTAYSIFFFTRIGLLCTRNQWIRLLTRLKFV